MKRSFNCINNKSSPRRGIKISWLTVVKAIGYPFVTVAADVGSDGKLLHFMNSIFDTLQATNTTSYTINSAYDNLTDQHHFIVQNDPLFGLITASFWILVYSLLNLIFGNPSKTLIRNVRTYTFMASRELEAKDVPLPIGDYIVNLRCA